MSITRTKLLSLIFLLLSLTAARSDGISLSMTPNEFGGIDFSFGGGPSGHHGGSGPTGNDLLLEDGSSFLLLEDGSSKLCLESGC